MFSYLSHHWTFPRLLSQYCDLELARVQLGHADYILKSLIVHRIAVVLHSLHRVKIIPLSQTDPTTQAQTVELSNGKPFEKDPLLLGHLVLVCLVPHYLSVP